MSLLIFLGIILAFFVVAFIVSRITGARAHYLDAWMPEEGEEILFEDPKAEIWEVPKIKARYSAVRHPRSWVRVTNRRVLAAQKVIFGSRYMILFVIYPGHAPGDEADSLGGGLLKRGYKTLVVDPGQVQRVLDAKKPFVVLFPAPEIPSSFNLESIRIFTSKASSFRLPPATLAPEPA